MVKQKLEFVEIMMINSCNLSCKGCTTFSDLKHQGSRINWSTAKQWIEDWSERLEFEGIGLIGGEPLLHPEVREYLIGMRKLLPNTQIRFVTNGLLLDKHWDVVELLNSLGNAVLKISYHVDSKKLDDIIQRVFDSYKWREVNEYGIDRWKNEQDFTFQVSSTDTFLKTYKGEYENMMPHDSNPKEAFEICVQKRCPMILDNTLYKCGTVGLTPPLLNRFGNPNIELWEQYIDDGLKPDCENKDLEMFVNNFGKPHSICRQCPTKNDVQSFVEHFPTVEFK